MANIIVKSYEHINSALPNWDTPKGKYIKNKDHYDREMKKAGMVSYEKANKSSQRKEYQVSQTSQEIIREVKATADRRGNVKLSDRQIGALIKSGAIKDHSKLRVVPETIKGGFQ